MTRTRRSMPFCVAIAAIAASALARPGDSQADEPNPNAAPPPSKPSERVANVLQWLPADTQTLIVDQAPAEKTPDSLEILQEPLTKFLPSGAAATEAPLALIVHGARRFRSPGDFSLLPYQGATILVFEKDLKDADPVFDPDMAPRIITIGGIRVLQFQRKLGADEWTFYVTRPKPNVLICATDRDYLTEVLSGTLERPGPRALPEDLPEWTCVDTSARFWAIRHFDPKDVQLDPTTPLGKWKQVPEDDGAIGATFSYDPAKRLGVVNHLSRSKDAEKGHRMSWDGTKAKFTGTLVRPDFRATTFAVTPDVSDLLFRLGWLLGHGAVV